MIPGGEFTTIPDIAVFLPPLDQPYQPLTQIVWGGVGLNDPSQGRMVQYWQVSYDGANINIGPVSGSTVFTLAQPNVDSVSMGFDANMNPVIGWQSGGSASIYFYNVNAFETLTITDTTSSRVFLDDPRSFNTADSDVMFAYTKNNMLYYRQQRDNYAIEYEIGATTGFLRKAGLNLKNRLQFELSPV